MHIPVDNSECKGKGATVVGARVERGKESMMGIFDGLPDTKGGKMSGVGISPPNFSNACVVRSGSLGVPN